MTITRHYPASDCISSLAYDDERRIAWATFRRDGTTIELDGFPEIEFERWITAGSVGRYFNANVRGRY
jgi:hypothetical protein